MTHLSTKPKFIFLTGMVLAGCSGPAGVAPRTNKTLELKTCSLDANTIAMSDVINIKATKCQSFSIVGSPLQIPAGKDITITDAPDTIISGALAIDGRMTAIARTPNSKFSGLTDSRESSPDYRVDVNGSFLTVNFGFTGPGTIFFGNEKAAPVAVSMQNGSFASDQFGAPALNLFGNKTNCEELADTENFIFINMDVNELQNDSLNMYNQPTYTSGLTFHPKANAKFKANLGAVCVKNGKALDLSAAGLSYFADEITIFGTLTIKNTNLNIRENSLTVDGGLLIVDNDTKIEGDNSITFSKSISANERKIVLKNHANSHFRNATIDGSVHASSSTIVAKDSTFIHPCINEPTLPICDSTPNSAPLVLSENTKAELEKVDLQSANGSQIHIDDNEEQTSEITVNGEESQYKITTNNGVTYRPYTMLIIEENMALEKSIVSDLLKLNGSYAGPCITEGAESDTSLRRIYTFENIIETIPASAQKLEYYVPRTLTVTRTIQNYSGSACNTLTITSDTTAKVKYFKKYRDNLASAVLMSGTRYEFFQQIWTISNQSFLNIYNQESVCGINDWKVNVPQNITGRSCFGSILQMPNYFDRFEHLESNNILLGTDYEDRLDHLAHFMPLNVDRSIELIKIK